MDLPNDFQVYILKIILVVPDGIMNPWLRRDAWGWRQLSGSFKRRETFLEPNILATCREIHEISTPILYGYNTFRLVNQFSQTGSRSYLEIPSELNIFTGNYDTKPNPIQELFNFEHRASTVETNGYSYLKVPRFKMIKHLMLQSSGLDYNDLASKGVAMPLDTSRRQLTKLSELWTILHRL
jgi:hypothetical protein